MESAFANMNDEASPCEQLAAHAWRFAAFTGLREVDAMDRFFLIVGPPGSGKTSFISRCTSKDVGNCERLPSCTDTINIYDYKWHGRRIYLIDTPGFDDPNRSNIDTLKVLATYLGASYANEVRIDGVLMLQSIEEDERPSQIIQNISMVLAMCGFVCYRHFGIATTMWPHQPEPNDGKLIWNRSAMIQDREAGILHTYYGDLKQHEAFSRRYNESGTWNPYEQKASAQYIMAHLIALSDAYKPEVLRFQREVFRERKTLAQTAAGINAGVGLYKSRKAYEVHLEELNGKMETASESGDTKILDELKKVKDEVVDYLDRALEERKVLKKTFGDLHGEEKEAWRKSMDNLEQEFRDEVNGKKKELSELEDFLRGLHEDAKREFRSAREEEKVIRELKEYDESIRNGKLVLIEAQGAYSEFRQRKVEIFSKLDSDEGAVCTVM